MPETASRVRIRSAFREVALGLIEWRDVPAWPRLSDEWSCPDAPPIVYRSRGKQEYPDYAEPFDVDADWNERA